MVEHGINVDGDSILTQLLHGLFKLLTGSILGAVGRFNLGILVTRVGELAKVPQVVAINSARQCE